MADITKCMGRNCPRKKNCYRYTATENPFRQAYFTETPYKDGKCDKFMEIVEEPKKKSPKKPNKQSNA